MRQKLDLQSIIIFKDLDEKVLDQVYDLDIEEYKFDPGDLVVSQGDELTDLVVIKTGLLKQAKYLADGSERVVAYYYEREVYPLHLFYAGFDEWPYDIYSEFESDIFFIPWNDLFPIINSDKKFMNNILKFTAQCTCHTKMILNSTRYKKIRQRLAYWLLMKKYIADFKIPSTQKMLSDTLRVTRPSLNQELKKLESKGIIEINQNDITVLNEDGLKKILEDV